MNIYSISEITDYMESVFPQSKHSSSSYESIAKKYIDMCVFECLRGFKNQEDDADTIEFRISHLNNNILNRYNGNCYWLPVLRDNFPFFTTIQRGWRNSDVAVLSQVKPVFSHQELICYAYRVDLTETADQLYPTGNGGVIHTPIDMPNLKRYINNMMLTASETNTADAKKIYNRIFSALNIYHSAKRSGGILRQEYSVKDTGREYCRGINLQNCSSAVRHAALGACHKYDLRSSMFAVMLSIINNRYALDDDLLKKSMINYIVRDKAEVRSILAKECLTETNATPEFKHRIIKSALQKIGFGSNPGNYKSGVAQDIWNAADRQRFIDHWIIRDLMTEIDLYKEIMRETYPDAKKSFGDALRKNGRSSLNKWCTYHYQLTESTIIQAVKQTFGEENVLLQVHDALYFTHKPDLWELNQIAKRISPFCEFEYEYIEGEWADKRALNEQATAESKHKHSIWREEQLAQQYSNRYSGWERNQIYSTDWNRLSDQNQEINRMWKKLSK